MVIDAIPQPETDAAELQLHKTVLVVDDDRDQADVLSMRLEGQGYNTIIANTGADALERAKQRVPNLIVLDLRLPDMSGFEVCQSLGDDVKTCQIPVIILSGMERPDIVRRARSVGSSYYVRKPYDPNALLVLIENAVQEATDW